MPKSKLPVEKERISVTVDKAVINALPVETNRSSLVNTLLKNHIAKKSK